MVLLVAFIATVSLAETARAQGVENLVIDTSAIGNVTTQVPITLPARLPEVPKHERATGLRLLYATTVVTQGLDLHSTLIGIRSGGAEGNPIMSGLTRRPALLIATKASATACILLSTHHLAKSHRRAAMVTLIAINATYGIVSVRNYRIAQAGR